MNWKLMIALMAVASLSLTFLSWYFTMQLNPNGWGILAMGILSLGLSFISLIILLFPLGMAMEQPGKNGKLYTFLLFVIMLLFPVSFFIYSPKAFINGYYSWVALGVFGFMSIYTFIQYYRSKGDEY